jgi:hypothetical protein
LDVRKKLADFIAHAAHAMLQLLNKIKARKVDLALFAFLAIILTGY